jgi:trimeric autotransporter adhesin
VRRDPTRGNGRSKTTRLSCALRASAGAVVVVGVVGLAALAWAYWTAGGTGSATVTVGGLAAPSSVTATATPGSATVPIAWTASSAPGGNNLDGYYVQRYAGSTASAACGSSPGALLNANATGCNDTSVGSGNYTYTATAVFRSWTATSNASALVNVNPAAPHLAFVKQPGGGTGGVAWPTQPKVAVVDGSGNTLPVSPVAVTLSVTAGSGNAAGVLSCMANPKTTAAGAVTFAGCNITLAGTGYALTASAPGYPSAVSSGFNVTVGPATQLSFVQQPPSSVVAGVVMSPAVSVAVQDDGGNGVLSTVSIAFGTNAGGGTLSGTLTRNASNGIATFADLSVDAAASSYTLKATTAGLAATSTTFTVNPAAPVALAFARQPGGGTGGSPWATQPKVAVVDRLGNTVPVSPVTVTLSVTPGSGNPAGVLGCQSNANGTAAGVASFSYCKIDVAATAYSLTASAPGYPSVVSIQFNVTVGPAVQLDFVRPPSTVAAGAVMTPAVTIEVADAGGNLVQSSTAPVSIAFGANNLGGTLSGTLSHNAASGVATFNNLSIDVAWSGYTLKATSAGLTAVTSPTFTVNPGAPVALIFVKQPTGGTHGVAWGTQPKIAVVDAEGNTVSVAPLAVTLSVTPGSGNPSGVLTCTANPKSTTAGVVVFAGCKISLAGTGYKLTASAPGYPSVISSPFNLS